MEVNVLAVLAILTLHWWADFVCQTDKQAKGKSKNWGDLLAHTGTYSLVFLFGMPIIFAIFLDIKYTSTLVYCSIIYAFVTFICHTITDYFTSRLNSRLYSEGKIHQFFVSVGFDQLLHFTQLLILFQFM